MVENSGGLSDHKGVKEIESQLKRYLQNVSDQWTLEWDAPEVAEGIRGVELAIEHCKDREELIMEIICLDRPFLYIVAEMQAESILDSIHFYEKHKEFIEGLPCTYDDNELELEYMEDLVKEREHWKRETVESLNNIDDLIKNAYELMTIVVYGSKLLDYYNSLHEPTETTEGFEKSIKGKYIPTLRVIEKALNIAMQYKNM